MARTDDELRVDALAIWRAGVAAVDSSRLVQEALRVDGEWLVVGEARWRLSEVGRITVVGAGKAGAGMTAGLLTALGPAILASKKVAGWVNVPADCVPSTDSAAAAGPIHLHAARPAGVNEPTAAAVEGTERILELVAGLGKSDLCICLISGGGSALLPAPVPGVSLADKQALTRLLSAAGANIRELNAVRKQLSRVKGGGLARACRAGHLVTLIISDVLGDPLDVIASGPTAPDFATAGEALAVLARYGVDPQAAPAALAYLRERATHSAPAIQPACRVTNLVIGNNALAVDAAGSEAERRGYQHAMDAATSLEGPAEEVGRHLAGVALRMRAEPGPNCLITGGEPTVKLAPPETRGKGGRNQQLVLAALVELLAADEKSPAAAAAGICLLSGGTDGEDGPTDAAGGVLDRQVVKRMAALGLDPADYLSRNDAYSFFKASGGLIHTGPTHTNVCDVRVVLVDRR